MITGSKATQAANIEIVIKRLTASGVSFPIYALMIRSVGNTADITVLASSSVTISMNQNRSGQLVELPGPALSAQVQTAFLNEGINNVQNRAKRSHANAQIPFQQLLSSGSWKFSHRKPRIPTSAGTKMTPVSLGCRGGASLNIDTVSPNNTVVDNRISMYAASIPMTVASQGTKADFASNAAAIKSGRPAAVA